MQPFYYLELHFSPPSVVTIIIAPFKFGWGVLAGQKTRKWPQSKPNSFIIQLKKKCQLFQKMKIKRVNSNIEIPCLVGGLDQESSPPISLARVCQLIIHKEQHHAMMKTDSPTPFSST